MTAAATAQEEWGETPAAERARLMFRLRELLEENKDRLARSISKDMALAANSLRHLAIEAGKRALQLPCSAMRLLPQVLRVVEFVLSLRGEGLSCEKLCEFSLRVVENVDGEALVALNFLCGRGFVVQADQQRGRLLGGDGRKCRDGRACFARRAIAGRDGDGGGDAAHRHSKKGATKETEVETKAAGEGARTCNESTGARPLGNKRATRSHRARAMSYLCHICVTSVVVFWSLKFLFFAHGRAFFC